MTPTIGRIVHYRLSKDDADKTNARREDAMRNVEKMREERPGFQAHVGSSNRIEGDVCAMIVTAVAPIGHVNGQVLLDGNDSLWVMTVQQGDEPGQWQWPPRA